MTGPALSARTASCALSGTPSPFGCLRGSLPSVSEAGRFPCGAARTERVAALGAPPHHDPVQVALPRHADAVWGSEELSIRVIQLSAPVEY